VARTPLWVARLGLSWQEQVSRTSLAQGSLLFVPEASAAGVSVAGLVEERLLPRTYVQLTARGGLATEGMPEPFLFTLQEFNSLAAPDDPGAPAAIPRAPTGEYKVSGTLSLWLPENNPDYLLGGLALLSDVRTRVYLSGARVWSTGDDWDDITTYAEAGGEVWTTLEALGGLLPVRLVVGLAWPLSPAGPGMLYLGIDL